jgi:asparagine synthase (glutamine-hydrolysing)
LMFELLKPEAVRKLFKAHQSGRQDNHKLLFSLVMLEQWLRRDWVPPRTRQGMQALPLAS